MEINALAKLDKATTMLAEARTLDGVKKIVDLSKAAKVYAQAHKLGQQAIDYATEIRFLAERKLGQMLKETPRNRGQLLRGTREEPRGNERTLGDIGLTKKESSRFQVIATLPEEQFKELSGGRSSN